MIIADTKDFLVVRKFSGEHMHSQCGAGIIERLRRERDDRELFPVHRLDSITSGLLLVAKGSKANKDLSELFCLRQIDKIYLAVLDKKPRKKQGTVTGDMEKSRNGDWKLTRNRTNPAVTCFFSYSYAAGRRCALVKPATGKTHQIRVAFKSLGAPILGDSRYGGTKHARACLHAWRLRFYWDGQVCEYEADFHETHFQEARFQEAKDSENSAFADPGLRQALAEVGDPFALAWPCDK